MVASNQLDAIADAMLKGKTSYTYKDADTGTKRTGSLPKTPSYQVLPKKPAKTRGVIVHAKGGRSRRRKNNRRGSGTRRRRHGKQQSLKSFFHF